jgi:hypothetical protein
MEKTEAPPKPAEPVSEPNPLYQMEELVARLQKMMRPLLDSTAIPAESREQMEAIFRLLKLVSFYGRETTKCLGASAFFAANVMGAATLETLLLVMCIMNETGVRSTNTWRNVLKGKGKPFLKVLGRADLEKVLQVGSELSWFSNRICRSCSKNTSSSILAKKQVPSFAMLCQREGVSRLTWRAMLVIDSILPSLSANPSNSQTQQGCSLACACCWRYHLSSNRT